MVFANRGLASRSALARPKPSRELLSRSLKKCGKSQIRGRTFDSYRTFSNFAREVRKSAVRVKCPASDLKMYCVSTYFRPLCFYF